MTPGQTRVLVLLLVLIAVELFLHPTALSTIKSAATVSKSPSGS